MPPPRRKSGTATKGKALKPGTAKVVSKTSVAVNLSGVEAGRRAPRIEEGDYRLRLTKAEAKIFKSKNPGVAWSFTVVGGKRDGTTIKPMNTVLETADGSNVLWKFRQVLEALGVKVTSSTKTYDVSKLVGRECGGTIVDGEPYNGKISSEVSDVFSLDQLVEDGDEDEEPDEDDDEDVLDEEDWDEDEGEDADEEDDEDVDLDDEDELE